jgi:hypothetical protein
LPLGLVVLTTLSVSCIVFVDADGFDILQLCTIVMITITIIEMNTVTITITLTVFFAAEIMHSPLLCIERDGGRAAR